jgi:acetyl-CoA decarbonylase/synthase complex subunit delta
VHINSHKTVKGFCSYSIMDRPMTSCGCFETICAYVPECNGVMAVNREFQGNAPTGMTFSIMAGNVGGGLQTPGFMGCGKIFLTSKKFLLAEGGYKRLVWMPKELKELLADDMNKRFVEQGVPDLMDKIADETIATDAHDVRAFMEKVRHPALDMPDMMHYTEKSPEQQPAAGFIAPAEEKIPDAPPAGMEKSSSQPATIAHGVIDEIRTQIKQAIMGEIRDAVTREVVRDIIETLGRKFPGGDFVINKERQNEQSPAEFTPAPVMEKSPEEAKPAPPAAAERVAGIKAFAIRKEKCEEPICVVKLGATREEGGTRGKTYLVGGATCMPFHLWEGDMPHRPLVAMEVFDSVSSKYPASLRGIYGELLKHPAEMARTCVDKYGADLISVRLEGSHPEKGNRTPEQSVELVQSVLKAVDVPLIISGHNHYEKNNAVMKAVAQAFEGENLLFNWVEQDNYRTIAGAALAYGHTVVAQSPIDVNIGKQLNILLTNMDVKREKIIMDPMTGATGYGIEYTYSVMERIRLTALGGDRMLAFPMIVSPGQECSRLKEAKAPETDFPAWGDLSKRAALWEISTAGSLLFSGADILIMYHPEAARVVKNMIFKLMDQAG